MSYTSQYELMEAMLLRQTREEMKERIKGYIKDESSRGNKDEPQSLHRYYAEERFWRRNCKCSHVTLHRQILIRDSSQRGSFPRHQTRVVIEGSSSVIERRTSQES